MQKCVHYENDQGTVGAKYLGAWAHHSKRGWEDVKGEGGARLYGLLCGSVFFPPCMLAGWPNHVCISNDR
jgi:hypothetical protein